MKEKHKKRDVDKHREEVFELKDHAKGKRERERGEELYTSYPPWCFGLWEARWG
jgi:hypothetical protein